MKISFCIPTYNRCEVLEELIASIANQEKHSFDVEVCISDNASTDGTQELIDKWEEMYGVTIIYSRNEANIGPDRNYLAAVSLASGDYCWLLGSDDILSPEALQCLSGFISSECDLYLCDRREFNYDMKIINFEHRRWLNSDSNIYSFSNDADYIKYFKSCRTLGGVFSYLSSLIVKRKKWNSIAFSNKYVGSAYMHVYVLLSIMKNADFFKLQYISLPLVWCRGGNDSFLDNGLAKRIEIDLKGYVNFAYDFYTNPAIRSEFLKVLLRERPWFYNSLLVGHYGTEIVKKSVAECYHKMGKNKIITYLFYRIGTLGFYAYKIKFIQNRIAPLIKTIR
ncbi:glycosyltransferase family 2 protein [Symbiopectobacterium sp. Eva_TO]